MFYLLIASVHLFVPQVGAFFAFSSFAVDGLSKGEHALRFETCALHAGWMAATVSRTVIDSVSSSWRLTSLTCGSETHVDSLTAVSLVGVAASCAELIAAGAGWTLDALAVETVRVCYGLHQLPLEENFDLFAALVETEQRTVLSRHSPSSVMAFALTESQRPVPVQVVCDTEEEKDSSCLISRGRQSLTIKRAADKGVLTVGNFACGWDTLPFLRLPLHAGDNLRDEPLRKIARAVDVTALCATVQDMRQVAKADRNPLRPLDEECVLSAGEGAKVSVRRAAGRGNSLWEFNYVYCGQRVVGYKSQLVRDRKKAAIVKRLETHMNANTTRDSHTPFHGFNRYTLHNPDTQPNTCHFLRLDQGSGLSFNQLCP